MTDQLSRQTSSTDQLASIAYFLDELDLKTPIRPLAKETDGNTALLDTINSLVSVGAFIAGVQTQVIALASTNDHDTLGRVTNWFAFVGLTLDLIGTSAGVARALLLQAAIRRSHRLVVRLTGQIDGARHQVRELQRRNLDLDAAPHARAFLTRSVRAISRIVALLSEDERFGVHSTADITDIKAAGEAALDALDALDNSGRRKNRFLSRVWFGNFILPHIHVEGLGYIPVVSLAGGALCLLMSVMLYAGSSQPRGIWITCSTVFVCMLTFTIMFPTTNSHKRKRAVLYDRVEEALQRCPPVQPPLYSGSVPHEKEFSA